MNSLCNNQIWGKLYHNNNVTMIKSDGNDVTMIKSGGNDVTMIKSSGNDVKMIKSEGNYVTMIKIYWKLCHNDQTWFKLYPNNQFWGKLCQNYQIWGKLCRNNRFDGNYVTHDDIIKWKHFLSYWPFVRGIHQSPVNSPHKDQWHGPLMFSLICIWINDWINNHEAGDLIGYHTHYDVIVMVIKSDGNYIQQ